MELSKQIKKFREKEGYSQEDLAEKIYVSRQTISNWENEKSYPDIHNILILSVLFNVSLDELVKGDLEKMKKEVSASTMSFWARMMMVCMVLMPISIAPMMKLFNVWGLVIPAILGIGLLFSAFKAEKIKKENNIKTYSEIVAYMENKDADKEKIVIERKHYIRDKLLMMLASAVITLVLIGIGFALFSIF